MTGNGKRKSTVLHRLMVHDDGRLKTGRLTILVVAITFLCVGMLFKLQEPLNQVQVKITHVFEPKAQDEEKVIKADKDQKPEPVVEQVSPTILDEKEEKPPIQDIAQDRVLPEPEPESEPQVVQQQVSEAMATEVHLTEVAEKVQEVEVLEKTIDPPVAMEPVPQKQAQPLKVDDLLRSVILDKDAYQDMHRKWLALGKGGSKPTDTLPLRVENLRESHSLLQMKAVVRQGDKFYDLGDGMLIPADVLSGEYSSRVFAVSEYDPWTLWAEELQRAGLKRHQQIEVRYYMYDSIKNAIYLRAGQAFDCARQNGVIPMDSTESQVDVLGRVFVINRMGGGRFGVFVPLSIDLIEESKRVPVDLACFDGQDDIALLHQSGLL